MGLPSGLPTIGRVDLERHRFAWLGPGHLEIEDVAELRVRWRDHQGRRTGREGSDRRRRRDNSRGRGGTGRRRRWGRWRRNHQYLTLGDAVLCDDLVGGDQGRDRATELLRDAA